MNDQFERTAVKLSQGPLGIIALFIVLIYGFASMVLGFARDIGESNRSILVWFLVSFPVFVFFTFAWLVSGHHSKLYPPQAFREDGYFVSLAFGRTSFDKSDTQAHSRKESATSVESLKTRSTGALYWLGHDLMWSADALLRNGPSEDIQVGLAQALHHLVQIGLKETSLEREIRDLGKLIQQSEEIPPSLRDAYASRLGSIIDRIGMAAEAAQADFQVPPHWKRFRTHNAG
jgi:hypothetical protein